MEHDLTKGPVIQTMTRFVIPFLISTVIQLLYSVVDMIIVGRFANPAALAAINTSGQVMFIVTSLIVGLTTGGTIVVGQNFGAGKREKVNDAVTGIFYISIGATIILTAILLIFTNGIIFITRVPGESAAPAAVYLRICACGIIFISGYNAVSGILRGIGDSRHPMYFVIASCLFNVAGDLLLVGAFKMGAAGAAYATVLAQLLAFILSVVSLQKSDFPITKETLHFKSGPASEIFRIGLPLGLQEALPLMSFLLISVMINNMGFVERSAGVGVVERVIGVGQVWPMAFAPAISAFTAQNVGAGKFDRTKKGLRFSILFCLIVTGAIFVIVSLFPEGTLSLFSSDPDVIKYGSDYLRSYAYDIPLVSFVFCLNGFFSGFGKTKFTMGNCLVSTFFVRVPIVFFASRIPDVSFILIGCAAPITSFVQIIMQLVYYRFGSWKKVIQISGDTA